MDELLEDFFERNFAELQADGGHALAPGVRDTALLQVKLYWRRLHELARQVTQTEVKLTLPGQRSPEGLPFTIEGIVDVIREDERVTLYDVKTHKAEAVRADLDRYEGQLNVYAHIWRELYLETLDGTAVICTAIPTAVRTAIESGDTLASERALAAWDPIVPMTFSDDRLERTIADFGLVVDAIEHHHFLPRSPQDLQKIEPGMRTRFATEICRNCDARFSCSSYRLHVAGVRANLSAALGPQLDDVGSDDDRDDFTTAAIAGAPAAADDLLP